MKIKNLLSLALAGGVLFTGCNKEEGVNTSEPKELTYASIILENGTFTKADAGKTDTGVEAEKTISKLEFYVFDENGERDQELQGTYKGYSYFVGEDTKKSTQLILMSAGQRQVLVVANMDLGELTGMDKEDIEALLTGVGLPANDPRNVPANGIPMAGQSDVVTVAATQTTNNVAVPLRRLFARLNAPTWDSITVEIEKDEDLEDLNLDPAAQITFTLTGYVVINGLNDSYIQKYDTKLNGWEIGAGMAYHSSSYNDTTGDIISVYSGTTFINNDWVYAYENNPAIIVDNNGGKTISPKSVYAMLVEGTLSDGTETVTRYWRVNLSPDQAYVIYRNAQFNTDLVKVTTVGYGTPKDAEEDDDKVIPVPGQTGIEARVTIIDWDIFTDEIIL